MHTAMNAYTYVHTPQNILPVPIKDLKAVDVKHSDHNVISGLLFILNAIINPVHHPAKHSLIQCLNNKYTLITIPYYTAEKTNLADLNMPRLNLAGI